MRTTSWVSLPVVLLLCLSSLALSHSGSQHGQSYRSRERVEAQQEYHPLEHSVQDPTPLSSSFRTHSSISSPPLLLLTSPPLQLLRRYSENGARHHNNASKSKKTQHLKEEKHGGSRSKTDSEPSSRASRKSRKASSSSSQSSLTKEHRTGKEMEVKKHGNTASKKAKSGAIKPTSKRHKKASSKTFRQSTYHKHGKQYLVAHEDWYTQYRRNRSGPSSVMRKLTLESTRRRKAVVTIEPAMPLDDESVGSIEQEFGSPNALPGSLRGDVIITEQGGGEEDTEDSSDGEVGVGNNRTAEVQAVVKRPPMVGAGLVPRPVLVRPAGLVPKSRPNEGSSAGMTRTGAMAVAVVALLLSGAQFL